jgi:hypothetical protein
MAHYEDSKYKILELTEMPPGVFGETYVIAVGIHTSGLHFKGEFYVLTQRPSFALAHGGWRFSQPPLSEVLPTVDLDFMMNESAESAQLRLVDRLLVRAEELNAPQLLSTQIKLIERQGRPFVGCRLRGMFSDQLSEVADTTECPSLHRYLEAVLQIQPVRDL